MCPAQYKENIRKAEDSSNFLLIDQPSLPLPKHDRSHFMRVHGDGYFSVLPNLRGLIVCSAIFTRADLPNLRHGVMVTSISSSPILYPRTSQPRPSSVSFTALTNKEGWSTVTKEPVEGSMPRWRSVETARKGYQNSMPAENYSDSR